MTLIDLIHHDLKGWDKKEKRERKRDREERF